MLGEVMASFGGAVSPIKLFINFIVLSNMSNIQNVGEFYYIREIIKFNT